MNLTYFCLVLSRNLALCHFQAPRALITEHLVTNAKKRRGVVCASLTHLANHLKDFEGKVEEARTL